MISSIEIVTEGLKMAISELWKNKLRTFLSLFGVTIGIFCIISVLATINSLEQNIQNDLKSLGETTIYLDKWDYTAGAGGHEYPWWKFVKRPKPKYNDILQLKANSKYAEFICFEMSAEDNIRYNALELSNITIRGVSEDFDDIQTFNLCEGRYINDQEFSAGSNVGVIGNEIATKFFYDPQIAIGKEITVRGKKVRVIGVIEKQGSSMLGGGGWNYDNCVIMTYNFAKNILFENNSDPLILIKGYANIPFQQLNDELTIILRGMHRLPPQKENDFALNNINEFGKIVSNMFKPLNLGGWIVAGISLIVGMFGVANIMFVSVKERTSQIGLKKAIGAKSNTILIEFLLESFFLCLVGGLIGILLVFILTLILTYVLHFPVFISYTNLFIAITICVVVGVLAGFIPARQAAKLDPVVAIRK